MADQANIQLTGALEGETPLLVNTDEMTTIKQIYSVRAGKALDIYSLDDKLQIKNSHIVVIPQELYSTNIYDIGFSNGYHLQCSSNTGFMTKNGGWIKAANLIVDMDKVLGIEFRPDHGFDQTEYTVTYKEAKPIISQQLYLFISDYGNILVPYVGKEKDYISFIDISQ